MRYATVLFLVAFGWLQTSQAKAANSVSEASVKSTVVGTIAGDGSYTVDQGYLLNRITFKCFPSGGGQGRSVTATTDGGKMTWNSVITMLDKTVTYDCWAEMSVHEVATGNNYEYNSGTLTLKPDGNSHNP